MAVAAMWSVGVHHPFKSFNLCTLYMHYRFVHDGDDTCNNYSEIPHLLFSVLTLAMHFEILNVTAHPDALGNSHPGERGAVVLGTSLLLRPQH